MTEQINEIKSVAIETFLNVFEKYPDLLVIQDKTLSEWSEYFDIDLQDGSGDIYELRRKLRWASNKMDKCRSIYSALKLAKSVIDIDNKVSIGVSKKHYLDTKEVKTMAAAERKAKEEYASKEYAKLYSDMLLDAWKEQLDKLRDKIEAIKIHLYSKSSEMKATGSTFESDEEEYDDN